MAKHLLYSLLLSTLILSCSSHPPVEEQTSRDEPQAMEPPPERKDVWGWDYTQGPRGPENWAQLNGQYATCGEGQWQSPIDLVWHRPVSPNPLKIKYTEGNATVINAGYTYRIELTPQSEIRFQGQDYLLEKIEFRSPSEHSLSGNQLPMELQFYHRSPNGLKQAIVSLFVITGRGSVWFDELWDRTRDLPNFKSSPTFRFNPEQLIPPRQTFYQYQGSLTHPPCLENVQWFVFNTPLQLSKEQVARFRNLFAGNNRPRQPRNGRPITNY